MSADDKEFILHGELNALGLAYDLALKMRHPPAPTLHSEDANGPYRPLYVASESAPKLCNHSSRDIDRAFECAEAALKGDDVNVHKLFSVWSLFDRVDPPDQPLCHAAYALCVLVYQAKFGWVRVVEPDNHVLQLAREAGIDVEPTVLRWKMADVLGVSIANAPDIVIQAAYAAYSKHDDAGHDLARDIINDSFLDGDEDEPVEEAQ